MTNKSAAKGARGERLAIDALNKHTGLDFKRVPMSGAGHIKGDIFLVNKANKFCIESKNYAEDHLTSKILTSKESQFEKWWKQAVTQANKTDQLPMLIFRFNRSKLFVAFTCHALKDLHPKDLAYKHIKFTYGNEHPIFIAKLEDFLSNEDIEWTE